MYVISRKNLHEEQMGGEEKTLLTPIMIRILDLPHFNL
jgi:hypothetical protein